MILYDHECIFCDIMIIYYHIISYCHISSWRLHWCVSALVPRHFHRPRHQSPSASSQRCPPCGWPSPSRRSAEPRYLRTAEPTRSSRAWTQRTWPSARRSLHGRGTPGKVHGVSIVSWIQVDISWPMHECNIDRITPFHGKKMHVCRMPYAYIIIRPGPVCCPEVYRDVPGKFDDDDDDDDWRSSMNVEVPRGGKIKPLLRIFNECKRLTELGKLNPYWRSSMNVRV